ncbi:hypothetical protein [uncultured Microbacterium sp.]|uniref:hypothetical protein n=1 Tax=uncultured Microbacterium sp. TaxID=191216 RepID=UPI0025E1F89E|nr:hypothetical protein [uncultured Microbacterium sp.]
MSTTSKEVADTTFDDVTAAEQDAHRQDVELATLEERVTSGDLTVTAEAIEKQSALARHAHRVADGVRNLYVQSKARKRDRDIAQLAADIDTDTSTDSAALVKAWDTLEGAARALQELANAHDVKVAEWAERARELRISSEVEHGLNDQGGLRFRGELLPPIHAAHLFARLFIVPGGYYAPLPLREAHDGMIDATRAELERLGGDDE